NRGITSDQLEPSAKRPCTRTTFFAFGVVCAKAVRDRSELTAVAAVKRTKVRLSMSPSPQWLLISGVTDPEVLRAHHAQDAVDAEPGCTEAADGYPPPTRETRRP